MSTFRRFLEWCRQSYDGATGVVIVVASLLTILALGGHLSSYIASLATNFPAAQVQLGLDDRTAVMVSTARALASTSPIRLAVLGVGKINPSDALNKAAIDTDVDRLILTNGQGQVLARTNSPISSNDFIYERSTWGRAIASGREFSGIDASIISPMVIIGGVPIWNEDGSNIGGVLAADVVNDNFATKIENNYLPGAVNLVFYDASGNYLADSFDDQPSKALLELYISGDSAILGDRAVSWSRSLALGTKVYSVRNIPIRSGDGRQVGGALVFIPNSPFTSSVTIAAILALLVFVIEAGISRRLRPKTKESAEHIEIRNALVALLYFVVFAAVLFFIINASTVRLSKPKQAIYNSTLAFRPETDIYATGHSQNISVSVDSGGEKINAMQIEVGYDPAYVEVNSINLDHSLCNPDLVLQKDIDAEHGVVSLQCGLSPDGFTGRSGNVMELDILPKKVGQFSLEFGPDSRILASDGLGTDVLRQAMSSWYQIVDDKTSAMAGYTIIYSPTHPNPLRSYAKNHIELYWLPVSGTQYRYSLDNSKNGVPRGQFLNASSTELTVHNDGQFYFHIQPIGVDGLGNVSTYPITVDSTPPPPPIVRVSDSDVPAGYVARVEMENADALPSRKEGFYVKIDDGMLLPARSPLYIPFITPGRHQLTVQVFDVAGNKSQTTVTFQVYK